jgi:hypothetical protein
MKVWILFLVIPAVIGKSLDDKSATGKSTQINTRGKSYDRELQRRRCKNLHRN